MAAYESIEDLKTAITDTIYQNSAGLVTAQVLQERMIDIIDTLEALFATDGELSDAVDGIIDGAPGALDTLNEIAAAINDDAAFHTTITTALAAKADKNASILSKTGAYQLQSSDNNKIIECNGTFTITLPDSLDQGYQVIIVNIGSGTITLAAATTLLSKDSYTKLASQYGAASVYHRGSNVWLATGDLSA